MDDHALAADIAREAGELLLELQTQRATKSEGDRLSNDVILARLAAARPEDAILSEESKDFLVEKGWDPAMGARPLRRAIQRYIEDPLADEVLKTPMKPGSTVLVERDEQARAKAEADKSDEELKITILAPVEKPPEEQPVPVGGSDEGDEPPQDAGDSGDAGDQPEPPSES